MAADDAFLELEPVVGSLLERHLATTKEWFPHELVPYSRGRDFVAGETWSESDSVIAARRGGAQLALRQPPHRGQPPLLLPRHRRRVRPRRQLGRVGPPVDRRGGSSLHRHPRLPDGDARHRPGRARARPDGTGQQGRGAGADRSLQQRRLPDHARARDAHRAPQHRQAARRPGRLRAHGPCRSGRELPPPLLSRPHVSGDRARPVSDDDRDRSRGAHASPCPAPASRTSMCMRNASPAPASTTSTSTTSRSSCRS